MIPVLRFRALVIAAAVISSVGEVHADEPKAGVRPVMSLHNDGAADQDDMCVWRDAKNPANSVIITSDKEANRVFAYDLDGKLLQRIQVKKPGNIDIRYNVSLGPHRGDIVVVNQREQGTALRVFVVNPATRQLAQIDGNECVTGNNYGGCLYHSRKNGTLYFVCTAEDGTAKQYLLSAEKPIGVKAKLVRSWPIQRCEGAIADDESGILFVGEELGGVWKLGAEPDTPAPGELIVKIGDEGIEGDVEGLALADGLNGRRCLVLSDQDRNRFMVYDSRGTHEYIGQFTVAGAKESDGIEIITQSLGPKFPSGLFACHTDTDPRPVLVASWTDVAKAIKP